jgi:hypothetical protein
MLFNAFPLVNNQRMDRQLKLTEGLTPTFPFGADILLPHFEGVLRGNFETFCLSCRTIRASLKVLQVRRPHLPQQQKL